jgi:signal transduction histidine kinase
MSTLNKISLGDHVSKKMSVWVLILVAAITVGIITVSFIQSRQMFLKQVAGWTTIVPRQVITNLMDSDFYSIEHEVKFLESTELFSSFCIQDNQSRVVASFGAIPCIGRGLAIKDDAGVIWGYYFYQSDFYKFISPFLISGGIFLFLILLVYFFIKWRIKSNLGMEFFRFNQFLQDIEALTKKIPDIYQEAVEVQVTVSASHNAEQMIVNRAIQNLLDEIRKANMSLKEAVSEAEKKRYQEELTETALQVAHDIASPLAALECAVRSASLALSEESRLLVRNVADRLRGISSSLLKKSRQSNVYASDEVSSQQLLMPLINRVVQEKRLEYRGSENIHIDFNYCSDSYGLFSTIKCADFFRVLSNIINNAVEARDDSGIDVKVNFLNKGNYSVIEVVDNGKGMPAELVTKLGNKGVTQGKINGNGLGLYHATTAIKSWGGELLIKSEVGQGTIVSVYLPKSQSPAWFIPKISLMDKQTIVVLDDDQSIHDLWNSRFTDFQVSDITLIHLYSPEELDIWMKGTIIKDHVLYLCDYEFVGSKQNGIELISRHKINFISVLVTSRYYLESVISECEMHDIKLIPKDLAGMVPFDKYNTHRT